MRYYQTKLQPRSYRMDHIRRQVPPPFYFQTIPKKPRRFEDYPFTSTTFQALSHTEQGVLIVAIILLVGGGVALASAQSHHPIGIASTSHPLTQVAGIKEVQNAFFNQPLLPKRCTGSLSLKPILFYKGLIVKDVSNDISHCAKKSHGVSAGKVCNIDGVRHYLKVVETEDAHPDRKTNSLLGIYNLALVHNSLGVTVPKVFIAFEEKGSYPTDIEVAAPASFYVASESVDNFTTGGELMKKIHRENFFYQLKTPFSTQSLSSMKRHRVVAHIGEHGLAKLAVAGTFFQDLVNNDGNWGFNGHGLVIIDVDNSPATFEDYLAEAARMPRNIELDFSINTIIAMKKFYSDMLQKGLPVIHHSVDMKGIFYQSLIKIYIEACDAALVNIMEKYPALLPQIPTSVVNDVLSESFLKAMGCARRNGLFSICKRYDMSIESQDPDFFSSRNRGLYSSTH